jgi:hypothetical protein
MGKPLREDIGCDPGSRPPAEESAASHHIV